MTTPLVAEPQLRKPKWQRARYLNIERHPECVGRELWVLIGEPFISRAPLIGSNKLTEPELCVWSNQVESNGLRLTERSADIELLARGPEDFADEVEIVDFEEWAKEKQG